MMNIRHKDQRGETHTYWLHGKHSFSFGEYRDRAHMGFGPLRVINEDIVAPGGGFPMHGHANMEILTYVIEGALEHKDNLGSGGVIRPGDVQLMSAGKGILHSEFNASESDPVHLLQIWIMPSETGTRARYQQTTLPDDARRNTFAVLAAPAGTGKGLEILQDATISAAVLDAGKSLPLKLDAGRGYWLQVAKGEVTVGGHKLTAGDGLSITDHAAEETLTAVEGSDILLFDLPR